MKSKILIAPPGVKPEDTLHVQIDGVLWRFVPEAQPASQPSAEGHPDLLAYAVDRGHFRASALPAASGAEPVARVNNEGFIVEIDDVSIAPGTLLYASPVARQPLTTEKMNDAARTAQIDFCLGKFPSFEVALIRIVEGLHGIPAPQAGKGTHPSEKGDDHAD